MATPEQLARIPNFFLLGAAKCGTTSMYRMLKSHPEIFMSRYKETHFFYNKRKYNLGTAYYLDTFFTGAERYPLRGEASPEYLSHPTLVAPRMLDTCVADTLKFIVILRDPVRRAYSHYRHQARHCVETCSFVEALRLEQQRLDQNPYRNVGYYRDGLYGKLLSQWLDYFSLDRFLMISYEDLKRDWRNVFKGICLHLGLRTEFEWNEMSVINVGGSPRSEFVMRLVSYPPIPLRAVGRRILKRQQIGSLRAHLQKINTRTAPTPELERNVERHLRERYVQDVELLENLIGRDLSHWKPESGGAMRSRGNA